MARRPPSPAPRSPYITPEGLRRLEAEYRRLRSVERPRVTREVAEAAAQGDRSENAEYIYGKRRLREIDARLEFLTRRLEEIEVVEPRDRGDGRITFGCRVRLEDAEGRIAEYQLVGSDEVEAAAGRISIDSPVGRALLGRAAGDEVLVRRPRGEASFEILEVRYDAGAPAPTPRSGE